MHAHGPRSIFGAQGADGGGRIVFAAHAWLADAGIGKPSMGSKDNATAAISALCAEYGAWAVRVHDVEKSRDAVAIGNAWRAFANA